MNVIKSKLFRRYTSLALVICIAGFILAFYLNHLVIVSERAKHDSNYDVSEYTEIIDSIAPEKRAQSIQLLKKNRLIRRMTKSITLKDDRNNVITSVSHLGRSSSDHPFETKEVLLSGEPKQRLIIQSWSGEPPEKHTWLLIRIIIVEVIGIALGVGLTFFIIYNHFKKRTQEIENVLNNIRKGDLKSRMPVETIDDFGLAMKNFNIMADEIEELVGKLREAESTRRVLLGELAHDIRTPLASVRNYIEIVQTKEDKLSAEKKAEVFNTCQVEIEYMTRLVDDLLFLGRIEEPSYRQDDIELDLEDLIESSAYNIKRLYPHIDFHYQNNQSLKLKVHMDEVLASRLFRNVLDNAFSFAQSKVCVEVIQEEDGRIKIEVSDDGPGFHPSNLETFGVKKYSRDDRSRSNSQQRISIGLGSVIMKRIVELYSGEFYAKNLESSEHKILGGQVGMILPV